MSLLATAWRADADRDVVTTGAGNGPVEVRAGRPDCCVRVRVFPSGVYEIDVIDGMGQQVGYVQEPKPHQAGTKVVRGRLNKRARRKGKRP